MHDYIKVCVVVFSHHEELLLKSEIKVEIKVNSVHPWKDLMSIDKNRESNLENNNVSVMKGRREREVE